MALNTLVANFKSHKTTDEVLYWLEVVGKALELDSTLNKIIVCPQLQSVEEAQKVIEEKQWEGTFALGAQDISPYDEGAYTGEVAAVDLQGVVDYVIVGHSERRRLFRETSETIRKKADEAYRAGMLPIYCVDDETIPELEQVKDRNYLIAYEPLASIGTGQVADHAVINETITKIIGILGKDAKILYGGSVNAADVSTLTDLHLAGLLVGTASLDPHQFLELVYAIRKSGPASPTTATAA